MTPGTEASQADAGQPTNPYDLLAKRATALVGALRDALDSYSGAAGTETQIGNLLDEAQTFTASTPMHVDPRALAECMVSEASLADTVRFRLRTMAAALAGPSTSAELRDLMIAMSMSATVIDALERDAGNVIVHPGVLRNMVDALHPLIELVGPAPGADQYQYGLAVGVLVDLAKLAGEEVEVTHAPGLWARADARKGAPTELELARERIVALERDGQNIVAALNRHRELVPTEAATISSSLDTVRAMAAAAFGTGDGQ